MRREVLFLMMIMTGIFTSCVPQKKFQDAQSQITKLQSENKDLQGKLDDANGQIATLSGKINDLNDELRDMMNDTSALGDKYRKSLSDYHELNDLYDQTVEQNKMLLSKSSADRLALLDSLKKKQNDLKKKEDELALREQKMAELQSLLNRKDSATNALKQKIQQALLGFEGSDLTVEQKNGKVYVSLAEKLLFPSGSTDVNPKGKQALLKLSEVLKKNPDIKITVEGHTDNVPISTPVMKDNWDLSVLRSTSVIRILTDAGVSPKQIIASGRGEYFPVASNSTPEGKAKNRRTEIILTPDYAELAKILGTD
ncbi:MAG: OmpA family protein [Chitinophagales bacterium]